MNIGFVQKRKYHKGDKTTLSKLCSTAIPLALDIPIFTPLIRPKKDYDLLINWGLSHKKCGWVHERFCDQKGIMVVLNAPWFVHNSVDKFTALSIFRNSSIPTLQFTTIRDEALDWIEDGNTVFCRTLINSSQGKGIVIASSSNELEDAPLYTLRFKKKWEYRVHVAFGKIIKVQQKKRLSKEKREERGINYSDGLIRSYNNGYIFSNDLEHLIDSEVYLHITSIAIDAVKALGLDFGAVDIGVNKKGEGVVFEVNSAPGIEGDTINCYIHAFKEYINNFN